VVLDALGLEKSLWIEEVHKRFNILTLLNFAFRECIDTCFARKSDLQQTDALNQNEDNAENTKRLKQMNIQAGSKDLSPLSPKSLHSGTLSGNGHDDCGLSPESIDVIREQYDSKKFQNQFNVQLVDSVLKNGGSVDLFKDFDDKIRHKLLQIGEYGHLKAGKYDI